jgi:hypothetical protein
MSGAASTDPFSTQIDAFISKAGVRMNAVFDATVQDIVARLKEVTPVRTGYLRSNWIAVSDGSQLPVRDDDSVGFSVTDVHMARTVIILNPVVYARRINYGFVGKDKLGRTYHQAGRHMVEQVISEIPQIAANACQRITESPQ